MANNITVKDASSNNKVIHTIEDSTSAHYNMSIPITVSGIPIFTTAAPGVVSLADSVVGVSISPTQANIPVSIAGTPTVTATINDNAPVSVRGGVLGAVSLGSGSANIGTVSISPTQGNIPVSVVGTHPVTQSGTWNIGALTSVNSIVKVSIEGSLTVSGSTLVVSVGGVTSTQAVPIAFRDTGGDVRQPLLTTGGALIVHVCNAQAAPSSDVSVSPTQGSIPVSIAGGAINIADNAPVSVRGGVLGAVSLGGGSANIGTVSISPTQANIPVSLAPPTYNLPVSVHPVTQSGTWTVQPGNTPNTTPWLVSVTGNVSLSDNAPVSVRGGVLGAVSLGGGTATIGSVINAAGTALMGGVSVRQIVSVQPDGTANWPVSLAPPTFNVPVSLVNPSFNIGVSIAAVNGNIGVSIGGTNNVGVSVRAGAVSVNGIVTVDAKSNTGAAVPAGAFFVGGTAAGTLTGMQVDTNGAQIVAGAVTNAENSFTRPADTTAYASGDLVANNTTAGSVTPLAFPVSKFTAGGGTIFVRRARIVKSTGSLTNAQFRLHLYATSNGVTNQGVSVVGGDNAAYTASKVSTYLGFISVTMQVSHSDGAVGWGSPNEGMEMNVRLPSAQFNLQGLLEARAAYTPGNAERFNVTLEAYQE